MPNCVLTPAGPGVWKGTEGSTVLIDVESDNDNATKAKDADYPDLTKLPRNEDGHFKMVIQAGRHPLTVQIIPPANPDDWQIVEVCTGGTTQKLLGFPAGDQDGTVFIQSA